MLHVIPSVPLAASFKLRLLGSPQNLIVIHFFYLNIYNNMNFFQNHPRKKVFCNVSLSNLENILQINLRTDGVRECIFRVSGGTNFENFSAQHQPL